MACISSNQAMTSGMFSPIIHSEPYPFLHFGKDEIFFFFFLLIGRHKLNGKSCKLSILLMQTTPFQTIPFGCTSSCLTCNRLLLFHFPPAVGMIAAGQCDAVVAGGVEFMSDVPIRHSRKMRKTMLSLNKAKTLGQRLNLIGSIRLAHFSPEVSMCSTFTSGFQHVLLNMSGCVSAASCRGRVLHSWNYGPQRRSSGCCVRRLQTGAGRVRSAITHSRQKSSRWRAAGRRHFF